MKRLIVIIVLFCVLLTVPLAYFVLRTYHGLAQEEEGALRYFAESLFSRMEEDLARMVAQEEARGVFEYAAAGQAAPPADDGAARLPFVVGYLQNGPDGAMDLPEALNGLVDHPAGLNRERLALANAAFNRKRSLEIEIATAQAPPEQKPEAPAKTKALAKAQAPSIAENYLRQTPTREKSDSLGQKSARFEEITVGQARELASADRKGKLTDSFSRLFSRESKAPVQKVEEAAETGRGSSWDREAPPASDLGPPGSDEALPAPAEAPSLLAVADKERSGTENEAAAVLMEEQAREAPAVQQEPVAAAKPAPEGYGLLSKDASVFRQEAETRNASPFAAPQPPGAPVAQAPFAPAARVAHAPSAPESGAAHAPPAPAATAAPEAEMDQLQKKWEADADRRVKKLKTDLDQLQKKLEEDLDQVVKKSAEAAKAAGPAASQAAAGEGAANAAPERTRKPRPAQRPETRKVVVEVAPLQSLFLSPDTVFVFRRIMVGNETFRQGFVIDVPKLLDYFCRDLFEDQPMAGFAGLTLSAEDAGREVSLCRAGRSAAGHAFLLSRSFPRPFSFLSGSIASDSIPATGARSRLNTMIAILAGVLGLGLLALFWSARSAWEYSERRSAFVSSVTHELKTPLTNIRLYIEMLESGMAVDREREEEYLRVLSSESGRLSRLIENVLEFSRLERKKRVMDLCQGDLSEVLAAVRDACGPRLAMEGFAFHVRREEIEPFPYDREAMVQVLLNLVENARKFSAQAPEKEVVVEVVQDERETRITVSDKGPGIPRKALAKVFQDFYRVPSAGGPLVGGTGIGLALTRKLVYAMGGKVTARNNEGPGLSVVIRFARSRREQGPDLH